MSGMDNMGSTGSGTMTMKMYFHGSIGTDMLWFASWMPSSAGATVGVCIGLFILAIFERYLIAFRRACDASWRKGQIGYSRPTSEGSLPSTGKSTALLIPPNSSRRSSTQKDLYSPDYPTEQEKPLGDSATSSNSSSGNINPSAPAPSYSLNLSAEGEKEKQREQSHSHLPRAVRRTLDPGREGRWSRPFRWGVDLPRALLQSLQTLIHYLLMLVVMTFNIWWIISVVVGSGVGEMLFGRFGSSHAGH
ncbi:hypothetical protein IAR55_000664 [Kwoniella newhampshirensis]|uniref:Copper transport protein n=1 Tax=Kwoniella newhampshirensis TaxID=1651941 RepID=A0AAW0Z7E0_9TREE